MQYRKADNLGMESSLLGVGTMRFPLDKQNEEVDTVQVKQMLHYAIDNGVNYVDTAWVYHAGKSESITAAALKDGYREKVNLATKNPTWLVKKEGDWEYYLEEQLKRLETDHIDFYLQHALNKQNWEEVKKFNIWEKAMKAKQDGKIKYFGFSFHDSYDAFEEIINEYDWDFCQIQLNYLDQQYQAGLKGLKLAREKNIPVIIMEPLRGGLLAEVPDVIKEKLDDFYIVRKPAEWAFRWLSNQEGIITILSGMSSLEQIKDNVRIFSDKKLTGTGMSDEESALMDNIVEFWNAKAFIKCTDCKYCAPCPKGVNIPECFSLSNRFTNTSDDIVKDSVRKTYADMKANNAAANLCVSCKKCEKVCPQSIMIAEKLKELDKLLTK